MPNAQAARQADDHHHLADDAGAPGLEAIHQHAIDHAQQRSGEHRQRHHEAFLCRAQVQVRGHLHGQRPEHHPNHEAHVKVEERGQQRGKMPSLEKITFDHQ